MRLLTSALTIAAFSMSALAQEPLTPEAYVARIGHGAQIVPAGELTIDGKKVGCKQSPTVLDPNLRDFAMAFPGFIVLRPDVIATVTRPVALWIYYHECGHIHGIRNESKADCFAVQRGRRQKWLTSRGLGEVCNFIRKGRASHVHLSGPQRCAKMRQCFAQADASTGGPSASR